MKTTVVMVLYKQKIEESKTFNSLKTTVLSTEKYNDDFQFIIYDNSPEIQAFDGNRYKMDIRYIHDERNLGIAAAYNFALSAANENGSEWLLLLDHDTVITNDYFNHVINHVSNLNDINKDIAAVVPKIYSEDIMISPVYSDGIRLIKGDKPNEGIQDKPVMAINSGALISVSFLNRIGGFNEEFQLDFLDHWLFHVIYQQGFKVRLLNVSLDHELSVMDYKRVSFQRYKSILDSELRFYRNYKKSMYQLFKRNLAFRFAKQVLTVKDKRIAFYTLSKLFSK
ncbi:glycosyltransferase [Neobacillus terrae]|uniref:glycosyltransferase n=1 Tax=Neobacillus terrae TaxID=3034837 RepID=UPI00140BC60D|nr:glycosyltransferase [Neobacillus terrae]NHM29986.1 glycosyltransferase [Neobacillus terrae]